MVNYEVLFLGITVALFVILAAFTYTSLVFISRSYKNARIMGIPRRHLRAQKFIMLGFFLCAISGWIISAYWGKVADRDFKTDLVNLSTKIANGLNPRTLPSFSFSEEDLTTPDYQRLTNQLYLTSLKLDSCEIMTIYQHNDNFVYGPSVLINDSLYSPLPGTLFKGPDSVLESIFAGGDYISFGPYFNGSTEVITGFSAVLIPRSTEPILILGVSMPACKWNNEIMKARLLPLLFTLVFMGILWIGFIVLSRKRVIEFSGIIWWKSPAAIFTFLFSLIVTAIISMYLITIERNFRTAIFNQMSSVQATQIRSYIRNLDFRLGTVAQTLQNTTQLDEQQFQSISASLLSNHFILKTGLAVWNENYNRGFTPSAVLKFMEPTFEFPFIDGSPFPNVTLETEAVIKLTFKQNLIYFDGPFYLPVSSKEAICFFYPLTIAGPEPQAALFFVLAEPNRLLAEAIAVQGPGKDFFEIQQQFETGRTNGHVVASFPAGFDQQKRRSDLEAVYPHFIFGRVFNYSFFEGGQFLENHPVIASTFAPIIGFVLSLLLTFVVGSVSTRKAMLQKEVEARTQMLEQSEKRFAQLFSSMTEGVALHEIVRNSLGQTIDFLIVEANEVYLDHWNKNRDEVIGKGYFEIFGSDGPVKMSLVGHVVESKIPVELEYYHQPLNKHFHISFIPWGENGFAGIFSDITERIMAQQALKKSEEKYRMISENVGDVIWIYNLPTDRFTYFSPSMQKVFGYNQEEASQMGLKDLLTPQSLEYSVERIAKRVKAYEVGQNTDAVSVSILEQNKKGGEIIYTEVVTTLLPDEHGKVTEILGVTRDITENIKARKALEESELKYRMLIENQQDLVITVDSEGKYLYASPSFYETFGKEELEIIGSVFMPQMHEDDVVASLRAIQDLCNPPYKVYFEQRVKTVVGWRWIAWKNNTLFDSKGEIAGFMGVGRDITQQKNYEKQIEESRVKLQHQNEEYAMLNEEYMALNEELRCTNEELLQAIEKAKESENLKTAFLQNMSHEIRTPLNAVIGFSEMLTLTDLLDDDKHDYAEIIVNSSRQLLSIVNDILTISTLETRQEKINFAPVPLSTLMKELEAVFSPRALTKQIALNAIIPNNNDELVIEADEMKLKQVLNNLISNAIKFTSEGFVRFGYQLKERKAQFFVEDTGIGIPNDSLDVVFERFRQAPNNNPSIYGGTGLGLAISKGHVELMGGTIWVKSEQGKGSVFYFELPVSIDDFEDAV